MKWPATSDELKAAGYEYDNDSACKSCGAPIEWWISPKGNKMPISIKPSGSILKTNEDKRVSHFSDCPDAASFRRK